MRIIDDLKKIIKGGDEDDHGNSLFRNILILGMVGILLLLLSNSFINNQTSTPSIADKSPPIEKRSLSGFEERLARDLEEIISLVKGVGKVKVKVYARTGPTYEYEFDQNHTNKITSETDQNGGERQIEEDNRENKLVVLKDAQGNEDPVIKREVFPVITGVLIVAQGAEESEIKYKIIRSVSSLLNLPVHKISILPYERR